MNHNQERTLDDPVDGRWAVQCAESDIVIDSSVQNLDTV
eukprot:CAMPEP_0181241802 /NCGR_PEP_ID=MMETSP1096-20121128/41326_1 /TAXON_ID=156174 ORGANISM="Chrysochromulina ericina, Strain CCMP281" /NCGR_SAMPLE_ID=MMETSP1096 /ASSEMBLY_ACC=CAM_ASM_000453 /LENGTH=38 /DNA_ID= /DNA_START= /DNA_END= /DNA_ORIENTATION=